MILHNRKFANDWQSRFSKKGTGSGRLLARNEVMFWYSERWSSSFSNIPALHASFYVLLIGYDHATFLACHVFQAMCSACKARQKGNEKHVYDFEHTQHITCQRWPIQSQVG